MVFNRRAPGAAGEPGGRPRPEARAGPSSKRSIACGQTAEQRSVKDGKRSKAVKSGQNRQAIKGGQIGRRSKAVKSGRNRQAVKGGQKRSNRQAVKTASGQEQQAAKKQRAGTSRAVNRSNQHYPGPVRTGPSRDRPAGRLTRRAAAGPAGPGSPCTATCPSRRASTPACTSTAARRCTVTAP